MKVRILPKRQVLETKYTPYDSLRVNEERDTSLGETHKTAADAVCLSGFARLVTQHGVLLFVVVRTTLHECGGGGGVAQCTYGHIVFRSKVFDCWDGVSRDPDNRYARVLELDFL